ncbi:dephospho-CoA kinase [Azonexus sp. IMCC34839]|uniref:dephospho-CoA kinase n=1 Tax=Azonexus sp. IMCC34839 TaxID=3133695 RepID=UPI00399B4A88
MSAFVVGLTGGIGSGKSTVADLFVAEGAGLVDTDAIAHELTGPGGTAMAAIREAFGSEVVTQDGALERAAMRRLVFAQPEAKKRLEGILHPLIRQLATQRCRESAAPYVILAVPLLAETGAYRDFYDRVAVVDCPEALQIERVMARSGLSEQEVQAIMASQASRVQRLALADDVIVNSAGLGELLAQIKALNVKYMQLSAEKVKAAC